MCYDISFTVNIPEIGEYFPELVNDLQSELNFGPVDHIQGVSVFGKHPIIYVNRDDMKLHMGEMEWSCIEFYAREEPDMKKRNGMLNIRSERILGDPKSYWYKIRNRRCLIPVSGIYEHRAIRGWKKKVPYLVKPSDQTIFFLPGLYSVVELPDTSTGEMVKRYTFGLITRAANQLMTHIHNDGDNKGRMPLFLPLEMSKKFVGEELNEQEYQEILNFEMGSEELLARPVYTIRTGKPRPDGKAKTEAWDWELLPPLGMD
jgi:putative SOS response-associated peptidase YedK